MTARRRLVRVPASSANLGPGYDAMAAAMALHLELEVEETGEYGFETGGLDVPTGRENLIVRAFETLHPADAGAGLELGGDRRRPRRRRPPVRAGAHQGGAAGAGDRDRGASRQRRRRDLRRVRGLRGWR
jgi:hypothetical protein